MVKFTGTTWHVVEDNSHYYVSDGKKDICTVWTGDINDAKLLAASLAMSNLLRAYLQYQSLPPTGQEKLNDLTLRLLLEIDGEEDNNHV